MVSATDSGGKLLFNDSTVTKARRIRFKESTLAMPYHLEDKRLVLEKAS